jgi:HD-like signal output (HDOD) protein
LPRDEGRYVVDLAFAIGLITIFGIVVLALRFANKRTR